MPIQDAMQLKERILSYLQARGPSLPVHIAKATGLSILFASAFLSELYADKKIKISNMKVGSSPVYYTPEHESQLERFSEHLKSKEKDAYILLKEKKFLKDSNQEPAIRVALRAIKDFALPFEYENELYWKFLNADQSEFTPPKLGKLKKEEPKEEEIVVEEKITIEQEPQIDQERIEKILEIFEKPKEKSKKQAKKQTIVKKKKTTDQTKQDKFFNVVKEYLNANNKEITDIISFSKADLILKIKDKREKLLVAFNKKKILITDVLKASKKAAELELPYIILSLGETPKQIKDLTEAIKNLEEIEKI